MTDGNTALPVSPVTKEEAMNLSTLFSKAAQAVVAASEYPAQVEALRQQVDKLSQDLSNKTTHAEELDKTVHELRQQRDEARRELDATKHDFNVAQSQIDNLNINLQDRIDQVNNLIRSLDQTKRERDEYGLQVLDLEDQVKVWKEKAEKARVRLNDVMAVFKQDEPAPVPEPEAPKPGETLGTILPPSAPEPSYASPEPNPTPAPVSETGAAQPSPYGGSDQSKPAAEPAPADKPWWDRDDDKAPF